MFVAWSKTLMRVVEAFERAGVELIGEQAAQRKRWAWRSVERAGAAAEVGSMIRG